MQFPIWSDVLVKGVIVNDLTLRVEYASPDSRWSEKFLGRFDSGRCLVILKADLSEDAAKNTLLHEVIHAAFWMAGGGSVPGKKFEEFACTMLPSFLVRFRMDNPQVWAWIFDQGRDIKKDPSDVL